MLVVVVCCGFVGGLGFRTGEGCFWWLTCLPVAVGLPFGSIFVAARWFDCIVVDAFWFCLCCLFGDFVGCREFELVVLVLVGVAVAFVVGLRSYLWIVVLGGAFGRRLFVGFWCVAVWVGMVVISCDLVFSVGLV